MRGVLLGFAAGVAVGAAAAWLLLRSDVLTTSAVTETPSPRETPAAPTRARAAAPAVVSDTAAPPTASSDGAPTPKRKRRPATPPQRARPAAAAETPAVEEKPPPKEADVVAALRAFDAAAADAKEDAGTALDRAADGLRDSDEVVSGELVAKLLAHADADARYAGALLVRSTDAPPIDLVLNGADHDDDARVRYRLVETLPYLGEKTAARAVELVLDGHPSTAPLVDALVEEGFAAPFLASRRSQDLDSTLAAAIARHVWDKEAGRGLAQAAAGRLGELADALDPGDRVMFLSGIAAAGQETRVAALAFDVARSAATRESALDALESDEHWQIAQSAAEHVLEAGLPGAEVRQWAVKTLEAVARRDESDRRSLLATLQSAAAKDASAEVRDEARKAAERVARF